MTKKKTKYNKRRVSFAIALCATLVVGIAIVVGAKFGLFGSLSTKSGDDAVANVNAQQTEAEVPTIDDEANRKKIISEADKLAASYDYDNAIELIKKQEGYANYSDLTSAIQGYEQTKASCVKIDVTKVPHVFFHPLIYDSRVAFSSDMKEAFHTADTTVDEFNEILKELHANDYVLVGLHDIMPSYKTKNGKTKLKKGSIYLPAGKKPIIMSEDDTNYYNYWDQRGVANRLIVDEDGSPTNEVDNSDGTVTRGDYDVAPILDAFCEENPDFSYQGARAIIAVTGFQGLYGYRTSSFNKGDHSAARRDGANYDVKNQDFDANSEDAKKAKKVAECLKENGFELASHSFVHQRFDRSFVSDDFVLYDLKRVKYEIESIIGPLDIILYPNGTDITGFGTSYNGDKWGELFMKYGVRYFCSCDNTSSDNKSLDQTFMDAGISKNNYFRGGRLALDGYTMYYYKDKVEGILGLNVDKIWDKNRPSTKPKTY